MQAVKEFSLTCPIPIEQYPHVLLAHGGGGKLMHQLIERMFVSSFGNPLLEARHDGAVFDVGTARLAFTTDSYVVRPLFFPGGDIGSLAINGTVNDLAMCGARPLYLSAGFILEEGLPMEILWRVVQSNALRGFPVNQLDFALHRQFSLTERWTLQFSAEFFNVFNHPNLAAGRAVSMKAHYLDNRL